MRILVFLYVISCPLSWALAARRSPQKKQLSESGDRYRFRVMDADGDDPLPGVVVSLVYWKGSGTTDEKKEIERETDSNGLVEFPRVEADKLALSVTLKGYRSFWRWIRPSGAVEPTRIRMEKWAARNK